MTLADDRDGRSRVEHLDRLIAAVEASRFEDAAIRNLLLQLAAESDAPPALRASISQALRQLPADGLKAVALQALEAGLRQLPDAALLLGKWLGLR